jgi:hypothetical protein
MWRELMNNLGVAVAILVVLVLLILGVPEVWRLALGVEHHDPRDADLARDTEAKRQALAFANRPARAPHNRAARRLALKSTRRTAL